MSRTPARFPRPVELDEPVQQLTPQTHWRSWLVGGLMTVLTTAAGIIGSHLSGPTRDQFDQLARDLRAAQADAALDNATAHTAIWSKLAEMQRQRETWEEAAKPTRKRKARGNDE